MERRLNGSILWVITGLALLLRLGLFALVPHPDGFIYLPDSAEYDRLGWNLVAHGEYSLSESPPWTPDVTRTPVFPLFVAGCYGIAGHRLAVAIVVQLALSVLTGVTLYAIGKRFFDTTTAIVSAALLAVDPLSIRYSVLLLSETLFTLLFVSFLFCTLAYLRKPQVGRVVAMILLTGLIVLCRPIAMLWPVALLPIFGFIAWKEKQWRPLLHYGLFLVGTGAIAGAWVLRNYHVRGVAVLSTVQGINLYYYRAALTLCDEQNLEFSDAQRLLRDRLQQVVQEENLDYSQEYGLMEKWGVEISGSAPKSYLRVHWRGMVRMFLPQKPQELLLGSIPASAYWVELGFLAVLYGLALTGLLTGFAGPNRLAFLLLSGVVAYFAFLSGPEAYARFRVPVVPALALLAGAGLASLARSRQRWREAHG